MRINPSRFRSGCGGTRTRVHHKSLSYRGPLGLCNHLAPQRSSLEDSCISPRFRPSDTDWIGTPRPTAQGSTCRGDSVVALRPAALTKERDAMKPQVRRLRLRKSTLREVTSALAPEVVGGSVIFTDGCTYTCNTCNNTECCPSHGAKPTCDLSVCQLCD